MMLCGLAGFYLERLFLVSRPVAPSPEVGYTYPVDIKGKVVYLSWGEYTLKQWLFPASLLVGLAGGMLWVAADRRSNNG